MTDEKREKAIEWLEKAEIELTHLSTSRPGATKPISELINQALSLLQQPDCSLLAEARMTRAELSRLYSSQITDKMEESIKGLQELEKSPVEQSQCNKSKPLCKTCGGSGMKKTVWHHRDIYVPCPDCKDTGIQPDCSPSAEFVKKLRDEAHTLQLYDTPDSRRGEFKYIDIHKACDLLEARDKTIATLKNNAKHHEDAHNNCVDDLVKLIKENAEQAEALNPIREWYGGGTRSDLEILTNAIADLQKDRAKVLAQTKQIKRLEENNEKQGEECERRHELLCEINTITQQYFDQAPKKRE